jgi:transposase
MKEKLDVSIIGKIAEIIGRDHSTITKFLKRYDERNSVENKPKTRRKKLVTERGDRVILRSVKVNRRETLTDMASLPLHQFTRFFRFFNDTVKVFRTRRLV